jgi:CheY-like chemotaxis protein
VPEMLTDDHRQSQALFGVTATDELSSSDPTSAFLIRASAQLGPLQDLVQAIFQTTDENARQEILGDFYVRFNSLMPKADPAEDHPALRLTAALEGLLKKLLTNPKHCTSSASLTIATAVDLLQDLCTMRVRPDLATNPPIRLLAVDDDPIARRAITCALQMAFDQPENADSGETALALATGKPFDAIFMDVQMPGMDGFTACLRIHETVQNRTTPIVFVTGHSDFKARSQATVSGGSDFIGKPFLMAEIAVKALTFALRGRLQKHKMAQNLTLMPMEEEPKQDNLLPVPA